MCWIRTNEKLPEDNERVLITYNLTEDEQIVAIASYGKLWSGQNAIGFITDAGFLRLSLSEVNAWMPLPKPYSE